MNLGYLLLLAVSVADAEIGPLPFYFEPNLGQSDPGVQFVGRGRNVTVLLASGNSTVLAPGGQAVRMTLSGARPKATGALIEPQPGVSAYYTSPDPSQWLGRVPHFGGAHYSEIYPGIDVTYYGNPGNLEFDFRIKPGADPRHIRLTFDKPTAIEPSGNLVAGGLRYRKPTAYQIERGGKVFIEAGYRMAPGGVAFRLGPYDRSKSLTIDPVVVYTLRHSNSDAQTVSVDTDGAIYLGGASLSLPTTNGWALITKLNPAVGDNVPTLAYDLLIGGHTVTKLAVNGTGAVFATGFYSPGQYNFSSIRSLQGPGGGRDVFVTKVNPYNGTGAVTIAYATLLGGSGDEWPGGIAADSAGAAYVTGDTSSTNFPVLNGLPLAPSGPSDAFVAKLRPLSGSGNVELAYSTYLGGSAMDRATGIAIDSTGAAYVAGSTASPDFPVLRPWRTFQGTLNAFVTKFNPHGTGPISLDYSTLLSGTGPSATAFGMNPIAVDSAGAAYVGLHGSFTPTNGIQAPIFSASPLSWVARLAPHSGSGNAMLTYLTQVPDISSGTDSVVLDNSGKVTICGPERFYAVLFAIAPYTGGSAAKLWETRLFDLSSPLSCASGLRGETYLNSVASLLKLGADPAVGTQVPFFVGHLAVDPVHFTVSGTNCNLGAKTTGDQFSLPFAVPCTFTVPRGQIVSPGARVSLRSWSLAGSQLNPLTILGGDVDALLIETSKEFELTTTVQPSGAGQVMRTGISQPAAGWYAQGANAAVTAVPNGCYVFDSWQGAATGTSPSISLALNSPLSLKALFRLWENAGTRLSARLGAVRYDYRGRYFQAVWITNLTGSPLIAGIAADNLPPGVQMVNATATTTCTPPAGSPFRLLGSVPAGATYPFTIEFTKPANVQLIYSPRTITLGPAQLP